LELIKECQEEDYKYRQFWMKLYCFDNPRDPVQRLAIRSIGSVEQQNFIKMSDADKLLTTRRNWIDSVKRGVKG